MQCVKMEVADERAFGDSLGRKAHHGPILAWSAAIASHIGQRCIRAAARERWIAHLPVQRRQETAGRHSMARRVRPATRQRSRRGGVAGLTRLSGSTRARAASLSLTRTVTPGRRMASRRFKKWSEHRYNRWVARLWKRPATAFIYISARQRARRSVIQREVFRLASTFEVWADMSSALALPARMARLGRRGTDRLG